MKKKEKKPKLKKKAVNVDELKPKEIVLELDKYIVGQTKAKRAVAIAIRNRVRRKKVPEDFREEIYPKNIIMIGPTGCGKTEIARRLARLAGAPFVKVEATKYTEVGYVGRDVESMIRDLASTAVNLVQKEFREQVQEKALYYTQERLLDLLLPSSKRGETLEEEEYEAHRAEGGLRLQKKVQRGLDKEQAQDPAASVQAQRAKQAREMMAQKLLSGELEEHKIEIESQSNMIPMIQVMTGKPNMGDMDMHIQNMLGDLMPKRSKKRKVSIQEARRILHEEEVERLIDAEKVQEEALERAEQMGIIFIDELDKVCGRNMASSGPDISREGVQRDLLPIVEGATVHTRHGPLKTDHILFIAAGAFHSSSPADLIPELQGRFPIRVELDKLTEGDFRAILTTPRNSLVRQAKELLATEGVKLEVKADGIESLAAFAFEVNEKTENIGARRLHTLMEHLLDDISYNAPDLPPEKKNITIGRQFVIDRLADITKDQDLSRYIL